MLSLVAARLLSLFGGTTLGLRIRMASGAPIPGVGSRSVAQKQDASGAEVDDATGWLLRPISCS